MTQLRWQFAPSFTGKALVSFLSDRHESITKPVLVMGIGFDPRMNNMLFILHEAGVLSSVDIILLKYARNNSYRGQNSNFVDENIIALNAIVEGRCEISEIFIQTQDDGRGFVGDYKSIQAAHDLKGRLMNYTDIFIDIGALPTYISFPFIKETVKTLDESVSTANLFISTGVEQELDDRIVDVPDYCRYVAGFESNLHLEGMNSLPKIWAPVLGHGRFASISKLYDYIAPLEICPILPFPSDNPRRPDEIFIEYQQMLAEPYKVSPRDISYASELGPLDVYRRLNTLHYHFQKVLEPLCEGLGKSRTVVSPLCSKMLSIGVLLVVIENEGDGMGIANAFGGGHAPLNVAVFRKKKLEERALAQHTVWVAGEPFI